MSTQSKKSGLTVLFIANGYPSFSRPWKCPFNHRAVLSLADFCDVRVLAVRAWLPWRKAIVYAYENVHVQELLVFPSISTLRTLGLVSRIYSKLSLKIVVAQLYRFAQDVNLIHSVAIGTPAFAAQQVATELGIPHFVQLIGSDVTFLDPAIARQNGFRNWAKAVTGFISNSNSLRRQFKSVVDNELPVKTIYRGVDIAAFKPRKKPKCPSLRDAITVLYLGGYIKNNFDQPGGNVKGADMLLNAWISLEQKSPVPLKLIIGGPHINKRGINKFLEQLKFPERVSCVGSLPALAVHEMYARADLYVLPSRREGLPNVVLEAMASGVAVIATNVGGVSEVLRNGVDGIVVAAESSTEITTAISLLSLNREMRETIAASARARVVERFNSNRYGSRLAKIYRQCL